MPRIVHFEIYADDPKRAIKFYEGLFGWEFTKWESSEQEYWLITTGPDDEPGINGGLGGPRDLPDKAVNTIDVKDIEMVLEHIVDYGGEIIAPKMPVPGVGWLAYCRDTEGVLFGMMQADESAR
jgi:hypothetical protein